MKELTKREKTLIYILICFLLVVAGWFLLLQPALEKNTLVHSQYLEQQQKLSSLQKQLKDYESAPDQLKILEDSYNEIAGQYKNVLSNDDIDKFLTTKVLANDFKPISMTIGNITEASLKAADNTTTTEKTNNSVLKQVVVNMSLSGDITHLKKLMDSIDEVKGVEIASLTYQLSNNDKKTVALSFVMYMIEK